MVRASRLGLYEHTIVLERLRSGRCQGCLRRNRLTKSAILREEYDSSGEVQELRRDVQLMLDYGQASVVHAMKSMMADFMRDNGRSESGGAEGNAAVGESTAKVSTTAVGESSRGAVPTAVGETPAVFGAGAGIGQLESGSINGSAAVRRSPGTARPTAVRW